jgi:hypothetical protein
MCIAPPTQQPYALMPPLGRPPHPPAAGNQQLCPSSAPPAVNGPTPPVKKKAPPKKKALPKKAPPKNNNNAGSGGGKNMAFRPEEKLSVATLCDKHLPFRKEAWDQLMQEYNDWYLDCQRTRGSFRALFKKMYETAPPTGTPDMPEYIQLAKDAHEGIKAMASASTSQLDDEYEEPPPISHPSKDDSSDDDGDTQPKKEGKADGKAVVKKEKGAAIKNKFVSKGVRKKQAEQDLLQVFAKSEEARSKRDEKKLKYKLKQQKQRDKMILNAVTAFGAMFVQFMGAKQALGLPSLNQGLSFNFCKNSLKSQEKPQEEVSRDAKQAEQTHKNIRNSLKSHKTSPEDTERPTEKDHNIKKNYQDG